MAGGTEMKNKLIKWLGGYTSGDMRRYVTEVKTRELKVAAYNEGYLKGQNHHIECVQNRVYALSKENLALGAENEQLEAERDELLEEIAPLKHLLRNVLDSARKETAKKKKK